MNAQEPRDSTHGENMTLPTGKDLNVASSPSDVIEMRKQETRRRVTYGLVGVYVAVTAYCIVFGGEQLQASVLSGLLGIVGSVIGFYFGGQQAGKAE